MADPSAKNWERSKSDQELRRLSVVFCDVVGSTRLGAELDIEDFCALMDSFQELCQEKIDEAGGWLAQFQGDGVLAYFGYPALYEDPARRAIHSGLAVVNELKSRSFRLPSRSVRQLRARVSVHTGPVITFKDCEPAEQLPEGMSVNIAKKIQQFAPNNCVIVTSETEELTRSYFEFKGPNSVAIDYVKNDLSIYEVIGERAKAQQVRGSFDDNLPPIVARRGELQFFDDRWEMARQGLGQCVLLVGEAGIGKSRLIHEFKRRNAIDEEALHNIRCTPDTADSAFFPFREFLASRLSGAAPEDPNSLRRRARNHLRELGLLSEPNEQAFLSLLGAVPKTKDWEQVSPASVRHRINEFLISYFLACSESRALVLVFEDLHWSDASTREILPGLASRCRSATVFIICAQRPEGSNPFSGLTDVTSLVLNPLSPMQVKELVKNLNPDREISKPRASQLCQLTGGNPLFVEQIVASGGRYWKDVLEAPTTRRSNELATTLEQLPPTLEELVTYRLEQLGDAKRVAQCASVLGQFIHPHILESVLDEAEADFDRMIESLVRSNILAYTGETLLPKLCFRHALIREAAYETLLGSQKRKIHRRIAERLVKEQPKDDLIPYEVIARHFALAPEPRQSIAYWKLAAADASARFANDEALSHLREALAQVQDLPAGEAETSEIEIREALAVPLEAMRGWAADETERNLKRLLDLQSSHSNEVGVFSVYHGLFSMHAIRGEVTEAFGYAEKMQAVADRTGDSALRVLSLRVFGVLNFWIANFPTSLRLFEQMASVYTDDIRERVSAYYPANPVAIGHAFSALAYALTGNETESLAFVAKARDAISSVKDEFTRAYVEGFASSVFLALGRYDAAIESASTCLAVSRRNSFDYWISWAKITLGYGRLATCSQDHAALALMEDGLKAYGSTGSRLLLPYAFGLFADALIKSGNDERALATIRDLVRERRDNEVSFFDDFNSKLMTWSKNRS